VTALDELVAASRGHMPGTAKLRRVVVRMAAGDVARVDALRPRFGVSRAALVRAFCLAGLAMAEEQTETPPSPVAGAPQPEEEEAPLAPPGGAPPVLPLQCLQKRI
jgi:hypothetical protein